MNAILEYPLEALAFDYLSFGFFTAVITAAVSFWRIKASSVLPVPEPRGNFSSHAPPTPTLVTASSSSSSSQVERVLSTQKVFSMSKETSSTAITMMSSDTAFLVKEEGTKRKLTVHFKQDDDGERNGDEDGDQEGDHDGVELSKEWFENWEKSLKLRKGETWWYCYQDMKVINGSVVRLWDGCRRRRKAEATAFSVEVFSAW